MTAQLAAAFWNGSMQSYNHSASREGGHTAASSEPFLTPLKPTSLHQIWPKMSLKVQSCWELEEGQGDSRAAGIWFKSRSQPPVSTQPLAVCTVKAETSAVTSRYCQRTQVLKAFGQSEMITQITVKVSGSGYYSAWGMPLPPLRSTKSWCHGEAPGLTRFGAWKAASSPTASWGLQPFPTSTLCHPQLTVLTNTFQLSL